LPDAGVASPLVELGLGGREPGGVVGLIDKRLYWSRPAQALSLQSAVAVYRMAASAPLYARPEIIGGQQCGTADP
jgi:hypothetical protein